MEKQSSSKTELTVLRNYFWILLVLWTVLVGRDIGSEQKPRMGCNIKWKHGNEPEYAK